MRGYRKWRLTFRVREKLYEDVTASYAGSYGVGEGETAKAFRIYLNPAATWDDSKHTPIKAADYIYSMRQQAWTPS